ncbi:MAG: hypothetical protein ACREH3_10940 [Geminicoccales bacterium]
MIEPQPIAKSAVFDSGSAGTCFSRAVPRAGPSFSSACIVRRGRPAVKRALARRHAPPAFPPVQTRPSLTRPSLTRLLGETWRRGRSALEHRVLTAALKVSISTSPLSSSSISQRSQGPMIEQQMNRPSGAGLQNEHNGAGRSAMACDAPENARPKRGIEGGLVNQANRVVEVSYPMTIHAQ